MIECTGNNDKNIYWPPMSRGHYRECMARTYVGTFSLCRCQKEYYETSFSSHTLLVTGPPPTHSKRKKCLKVRQKLGTRKNLKIIFFKL